MWDTTGSYIYLVVTSCLSLIVLFHLIYLVHAPSSLTFVVYAHAAVYLSPSLCIPTYGIRASLPRVSRLDLLRLWVWRSPACILVLMRGSASEAPSGESSVVKEGESLSELQADLWMDVFLSHTRMPSFMTCGAKGTSLDMLVANLQAQDCVTLKHKKLFNVLYLK